MRLPGSKKNLALNFKEKCHCIEYGNENISIRKQCELLQLNRSMFYSSQKPVATKEEDCELMLLIDRLYTKKPCLGSRQLKHALEHLGHSVNRKKVQRSPWFRLPFLLTNLGHSVNRKKVQRLMRLMCLSSTLPKPWTSKRSKEHAVYPYLLKNLEITRADQMWSTDITYIPMEKGFMYLTAVIDLYSRKIISWELSNSLDTEFCLVVIKNALSKGKPEIVNTDQGCQYTSQDFINVLKQNGIRISMDSKGRALDNIFIERFWRTFKYEYLYCNEARDVKALSQGIRAYIEYYNEERYHSSIGTTPSKAYASRSGKMAA